MSSGFSKVTAYLAENKKDLIESFALGGSIDVFYLTIIESAPNIVVHLVSTVVTGLISAYLIFKLNRLLERKEKEKKDKEK